MFLYMPTRWRPLTCPCDLEYDGDGWTKTNKKCSLHKEHSGQKLLNAVRKHNIENSPKAKPETFEGEARVNFEPDWMKEVSKNPSLEKISEARFNLESMQQYDPTSREFQYTFSNFLSSARSTFWYLIKEYMDKFVIDTDVFFKDDKYREKNLNRLSQEAQRFVLWYDGRYKQLETEKSSFLIEKRDFNIHHGYVEQIFIIKIGFMVDSDQTKNEYEIPIDPSNVSAFFPENTDFTVIELCNEYLDNIEKLVDECHKKFPLTCVS